MGYVERQDDLNRQVREFFFASTAMAGVTFHHGDGGIGLEWRWLYSEELGSIGLNVPNDPDSHQIALTFSKIFSAALARSASDDALVAVVVDLDANRGHPRRHFEGLALLKEEDPGRLVRGRLRRVTVVRVRDQRILHAFCLGELDGALQRAVEAIDGPAHAPSTVAPAAYTSKR
jgi:hypothetical protein